MKRPANISRPTLKSATRLSPLQLNSFRFDVRHTLLTPELLEKMAAEKNKQTHPKVAKQKDKNG